MIQVRKSCRARMKWMMYIMDFLVILIFCGTIKAVEIDTQKSLHYFTTPSSKEFNTFIDVPLSTESSNLNKTISIYEDFINTNAYKAKKKSHHRRHKHGRHKNGFVKSSNDKIIDNILKTEAQNGNPDNLHIGRNYSSENNILNVDLSKVFNSKNSLTSDEVDVEQNIAAVFRNVALSNNNSIDHENNSKVNSQLALLNNYKRKGFNKLNKDYFNKSVISQIVNIKTDENDRISKVKRNSSPKPTSVPASIVTVMNTKLSSFSVNDANHEDGGQSANISVLMNISSSTISPYTVKSTTFKSIENQVNLKSENFFMMSTEQAHHVEKSTNLSHIESTTIAPAYAKIRRSNNNYLNYTSEKLQQIDESSSLSWLGLFFTQYRNVFWMTMNSIFLIVTLLCGIFSLYRLIWLQWCSALLSRTFYLVIHLLAFTGAAFLSVQLLHLLLGSEEGLPLILTLMLVHTPVSCLIVTLWFVIYCLLSSARLNFFGDYFPTSNHMAISSSLLIIGSFLCDIIIGATHSIWFLLLSRIMITMMAIIPQIMFLVKISKVAEVSKLLQREFQGELKLLVVPTNNTEISEQSDIKHLLRERVDRWSTIVFYCSIAGISLLLCNCVLSVFFTFSHVSIILWWFFHGLTCLMHYILIIGIIIASACTLQSEDQNDRNLLKLLNPPKTIRNNVVKSEIDHRNCTYERVPYSNVNTSLQTSVVPEECEDQYIVQANMLHGQHGQEYRPRPSLRRSATFNCDAQRLMYRRHNHALPTYIKRHDLQSTIQEVRPVGSTALVHEQGFIRFKTPMELSNPNIEMNYNYPNNFDDNNIYQSKSETGYGTLRPSSMRSPAMYYNDSIVSHPPPLESSRRHNHYSSSIQPQYKLHCQTKYLYSPMHVIRHPLNRNFSFTVPQSAINRGVTDNSPYLMKSREFDSSISNITPYSHADLNQTSNPSLTTFKPNSSNNTLEKTSLPQKVDLKEEGNDIEPIEFKEINKPPSPVKMNISSTSPSCSNSSSIHITTANRLSPKHDSVKINHPQTSLQMSPNMSLESTPKFSKLNLQTNTNHYPSVIDKTNCLHSPEKRNISSHNFLSNDKPNITINKLSDKMSLSNSPLSPLHSPELIKGSRNINGNIENGNVKSEDESLIEDSIGGPSFQTSSSMSSRSGSLTDNATDNTLPKTDINFINNEDKDDKMSPDRQITDKAPSLKRNHSTAGCYASSRRQSSFHKGTDSDFEFPKPDAKNEKYPWYGTWGGRRKSKRGIQNIAGQLQSSLVSLQSQPKILSSSRASLVSLYGKLKLKSKKLSNTSDNRNENNQEPEDVSCSSTADEDQFDNDETASEDTISNSKNMSDNDEDSDSVNGSVDKMSVDWTLEMIKSSELLSGFYSVQIKEENESESEDIDKSIDHPITNNSTDVKMS